MSPIHKQSTFSEAMSDAHVITDARPYLGERLPSLAFSIQKHYIRVQSL